MQLLEENCDREGADLTTFAELVLDTQRGSDAADRASGGQMDLLGAPDRVAAGPGRRLRKVSGSPVALSRRCRATEAGTAP